MRPAASAWWEAARAGVLGTLRRPARLAVLLVCCDLGAAIPSPAAAQEVTGALVGTVTGPDGTALEGVTVTATEVQRGRSWRAVSDEGGRFHLPRLPVGTYAVELRHIGYRTVRFPAVAVDLGRTTGLAPTVLAVEAVALPPLEVDARRPLIDGSDASLGSTLRSRLLDQLPAGRDYTSILQLLPQAGESFLGDPVNVAGSTGLENAYYVEGVDVTDVFRGRGGTTLPFELVDAVELKHGGYQAEYGRALGGIVNVVTKSGGERLRIRTFGTWTASGVAARAAAIPGVLEPRAFSTFDAGATVSGPLSPGRAWFFTAYDPSFVRQEVELPGLGLQRTRLTRHRFAAKLDGRLGPDTELAFTVFGDPSSELGIRPPSAGVQLLNADPVLTLYREGAVDASLRATTTVAGRLLLEATAARHAGREDIQGTTATGREEPTLIDRRNLPHIQVSGGNQSDQKLSTGRTSLRLAGSYLSGDHALKAGFELQDNGLHLRIREDPGQVTRLEDDLWQAAFLVQDVTVGNRVRSAWIEDSWALGDRWRLNLGLRWDGQALRDQNGHVGQRIEDEFQPRLGFVWQPGRPGSQKVFGHVGRFYQQLALYWATLTLAGFDQRQVFYSVDPRLFPEAVDSTRVFSEPDHIRGGVPGLRGEYQDEAVLGWERRLGRWSKVGLSGTYKVLRSSVTVAFGTDRELAGGNPGRGALGRIPASKREYAALELDLERSSPDLTLQASWVLSRNRGNYPGLYAADAGGLRGGSFGPNNDQLSYFPSQRVDSYGLLPNDRTHVVKVSGARSFGTGLTVGATFMAASGTPLSEFGRVPSGFNTPLFLAPRGSDGRTPAIWDLSLRLGQRIPGTEHGRLVLDLLHLGNPRTVVRVDQRRFNGAVGSPFASWEELVANQRGERAGFGSPLSFQPPFAVRLGLDLEIARNPRRR